MKVVLITKDLKPAGGIGRTSYEIISRMAERNAIELIVCVKEGTGRPYEHVVLSGRKTFIHVVRDGLRVRNLSQDADVVCALDGGYLGLVGYIAVLFRTIRFFIMGIGTYTIAPLDSAKLSWITRCMYRRATSMPAISTYVAHELKKRVPGLSAPVVHLGTTPIKRIDRDTYARYEAQYKLKEKYPIVLTVGGIKDRKGQHDVARAMNDITKKYPKATYCIVGSARHSEEYVHRIETHAQKHDLDVRVITDAKSDEALAYLYEAADVFVLASNNGHGHVEGFGLVLLEANQYGVPTIGTRNCGIEDAINDGESGVLVNQRAPKEIAQAIKIILENYKHYSNGARKWHSQFSWDTTVDQLIALFKHVPRM